MFSLELPENIIEVEHNVFRWCCSLRNIALSFNTVVSDEAFGECHDLLHIFGTEEAIVDSSRNRFDEFPVHSKLFYKSYYDQMTAEEILDTIIIDENELDPTGFQQDSGLFGDDTPSYYGLFDCPAP